MISGLTRAVAIDVHFSLGYIFWSDVKEQNIKRFRVDVASTTTIITGIGVCDGLAVDWRALQLYWTDTTLNTISVSDLDGNNQSRLIYSDLHEPRAIALDLDSRYDNILSLILLNITMTSVMKLNNFIQFRFLVRDSRLFIIIIIIIIIIYMITKIIPAF